LKGVEAVLPRAEAARRSRTYAPRIGDLVVLGDQDTVFGDLDVGEESLPLEYRSHGSVYELPVPLIVYNAQQAPAAGYFSHNLDLARWLYR